MCSSEDGCKAFRLPFRWCIPRSTEYHYTAPVVARFHALNNTAVHLSLASKVCTLHLMRMQTLTIFHHGYGIDTCFFLKPFAYLFP